MSDNSLSMKEEYIKFENFIKNYISEHGTQVEDYRKNTLKKISLLKIALILTPISSFILAFAMLPIGSKLENTTFTIITFMVFMTIYVISIHYGGPFYKNYRNSKIYKYKIYAQKYFKIDKILDYMGIRHINKFSDECIDLLNLSKNCDFVHQFSTTETCFGVNYLDKEFIVSDIITKIKDCNDEHTLVIKFGFNKDIKTDVFINHPMGTNENLPFESEKFNREFKVYSNDEVESRYLITTAFMERLLNAKKTFKFDYLEAAFLSKENVFVLAGKINNYSDIFEVSDINRSVCDMSIYTQFFFEILSLNKIAKYLKLNLDVGL